MPRCHAQSERQQLENVGHAGINARLLTKRRDFDYRDVERTRAGVTS